MEQIHERATQSQAIWDDIPAVFELIGIYRNRANLQFEQAETPWYKSFSNLSLVALLIIIGGLLAALHFLPPTIWGDSNEGIRTTLQIIVLFVYVLGGSVLILQLMSIKRVYRNFTGQVFGIVEEVSEHNVSLFKSLDSLQPQAVQYVASQLEQASSDLGVARSALVGAVEKVGIIPGLITAMFAISKVAATTGVSWIELVSFFMLGLYLSMLPIISAGIKTKRLSNLLNQYLTLIRHKQKALELGGASLGKES